MHAIAVNPLIAGLTADLVELAELRAGQTVTQVIGNAWRVLVHGR
jgi:hypothetical protein